MIRNQKILALIPARGGSKRLPGKNILNLAGKPLIAWSIEAANGSKYVDRVIVTTDDQDIANIAISFNAEVPFMRPGCLSTDEASSVDTVFHAIDSMNSIYGESYGYVILLQPTSPLRTSGHIDSAIKLLLDLDADGVVGICSKVNSRALDNENPYKIPIKSVVNTDNLALDVSGNRYKVNGAIYLSKVDVLTRELTFFHNDSYGYVMSSNESIDIDYEDDFKRCNFLIKNL